MNQLQRAYMKTLPSIQKAELLFTLLSKESKDDSEKELLTKIVEICKSCRDLNNPLVQAGRNLSLMLATESLSIENKSSILSAIDVLEKIRENELAKNN